MQTSQPIPRKKNPITLVIGIFILLPAILFCSGAVMLDTVGAKAIGKLSNAARNCSRGDSCWTGRMDFITADGEAITFYPLTFPMLFDFDPFLSGRSYAEYGDYQVRYLESYPKLAKVHLAFFLEYLNTLCVFVLGGIVTLFGLAGVRGTPDKPNKPFVLDLSKWRKS